MENLVIFALCMMNTALQLCCPAANCTTPHSPLLVNLLYCIFMWFCTDFRDPVRVVGDRAGVQGRVRQGPGRDAEAAQRRRLSGRRCGTHFTYLFSATCMHQQQCFNVVISASVFLGDSLCHVCVVSNISFSCRVLCLVGGGRGYPGHRSA